MCIYYIYTYIYTGAVTTGPVTVPLVIALGMGVAGAGANNSPLTGFGVVTLASLIPGVSIVYPSCEYHGIVSLSCFYRVFIVCLSCVYHGSCVYHCRSVWIGNHFCRSFCVCRIWSCHTCPLTHSTHVDVSCGCVTHVDVSHVWMRHAIDMHAS